MKSAHIMNRIPLSELLFKCRFSLKALWNKNTVFIIFLTVFSGLLHGQIFDQNKTKIDALLIQLKNSGEDSIKVDLLNAICTAYIRNDSYVEAKKYTEAAFSLAEKILYKKGLADGYYQNGFIYWHLDEFQKSLTFCFKALDLYEKSGDKTGVLNTLNRIGHNYADLSDFDKAMVYFKKSLQVSKEVNDQVGVARALDLIGFVYMNLSAYSKAMEYYYKALAINEKLHDNLGIAGTSNDIGELYEKLNNLPEALKFANKGLKLSFVLNDRSHAMESYEKLERIYKKMNNFQDAYQARVKYDEIKDAINTIESTVKVNQMQMQYDSDTKNREILLLNKDKVIQQKQIEKEKTTRNALLAGFVLLLLLVAAAYNRYRIKQKASKKLAQSLEMLKNTQQQLVQQEKLASLGVLIAGIAHEINNPLNFINNYSELNKELIDEFNDAVSDEEKKTILMYIQENLVKIKKHGIRAGSIVKSMLEHSRNSTGEKHFVDLNKMCDENLNLAYHGFKANYPEFSCEMKTNFETTLPKLNCVPQDISRVILNLTTNAFYELRNKQTGILEISTILINGKVVVKVKDNGKGIPDNIKEKIFEPFFTTKPSGQGTGLGLSLSYDIIKAHHGDLSVKSKENEFTEFEILLPLES